MLPVVRRRLSSSAASGTCSLDAPTCDGLPIAAPGAVWASAAAPLPDGASPALRAPTPALRTRFRWGGCRLHGAGMNGVTCAAPAPERGRLWPRAPAGVRPTGVGIRRRTPPLDAGAAGAGPGCTGGQNRLPACRPALLVRDLLLAPAACRLNVASHKLWPLFFLAGGLRLLDTARRAGFCRGTVLCDAARGGADDVAPLCCEVLRCSAGVRHGGSSGRAPCCAASGCGLLAAAAVGSLADGTSPERCRTVRGPCAACADCDSVR